MFEAVADSLIFILGFLVAISIVVFVHEFGHFWVARRCGVRVLTFSIGFGPELFGWSDAKGTRWRVSAVPLGGYVRFLGDADVASGRSDTSGLSEEEKADTYEAQPVGKRALIAVAGPAANYILAVPLFVIALAFSGGVSDAPVVGAVSPGYPAEQAGLQPGDEIIAINGTRIESFAEISAVIQEAGSGPLDVVIARDGTEIAAEIEPVPVSSGTAEPRRIIGVMPSNAPLPLGQAIERGIAAPYHLTVLTVDFILGLFDGSSDASGLAGPVGIVEMSGEAAQRGSVEFLTHIAFLSIALGFFNLLPIPMLDGGHLLFYGIEAVRRRRLSEKSQELGYRIGLAMILALLVFATVNDVTR